MKSRSFQSASGSVAVVTYYQDSNETRIALDGNEIYTGGGDRVDSIAQDYLDQGWTEI